MSPQLNSPKPVFAAVMRTLRPGGLFVLAGPNCANLRKRITLLLGRGKWGAMQDWYDAPRFRGHVREPDVEVLRYIAHGIPQLFVPNEWDSSKLDVAEIVKEFYEETPFLSYAISTAGKACRRRHGSGYLPLFWNCGLGRQQWVSRSHLVAPRPR